MDFSNEFNAGVYCVHKDNQAKLYIRISSPELRVELEDHYDKSLAEKFLKFTDKYGKYLEFWPLLFVGPVIAIFVISNISNTLSSMKSDM